MGLTNPRAISPNCGAKIQTQQVPGKIMKWQPFETHAEALAATVLSE
jgi:hypothetical protein